MTSDSAIFQSSHLFKSLTLIILANLIITLSSISFAQLSSRSNSWADINKVKNTESVQILAEHIYHSNVKVRMEIAKHPLAETMILSVLAKDKSWKVRRLVAMNQDLDVETVILLISDPKHKVRAAIAEHPLLFTIHLEKLAEDKSSEVRQVVASTLRTPITVLKTLANDKNKKVRQAANTTLGQ